MSEGDRVKSEVDGALGTIYEVYPNGSYYVVWDEGLYNDVYGEDDLALAPDPTDLIG